MIVISIVIMISAGGGSTQKRANEIDMLMSDRAVPRRQSTDQVRPELRKKDDYRITKGMK